MEKSNNFLNFFDKVVKKYFIKRGYFVSETMRKKMAFFGDVIFRLDENPKVDYSKGLIVYSDKYGQGKTFFFEVVYFISMTYMRKQAFKMTDSIELVEIFKSGGEDALREFVSVPRLFIDDIGNEKKRESTAYYKGSKTDVLAWVLEYRYEQWKKHGWKLFGTTNISLQSLAELYDGRLADRLMQSVYFENYDIMSSGSFRQMQNIELVHEEERKKMVEQYFKETKPEEKTEVDLAKYLNQCLSDSSADMKAYGQVTLNFIKRLLIERNMITDAELNRYDEEDLEKAEKEYEREIREGVLSAFKNTIATIRKNKVDQEVNALTNDDLINYCQNQNVIKKLIQLKHAKYEFTA